MSPEYDDVSNTHPFINFEFDVDVLTRHTWMLLGETMSKCQHLAGAPLTPTLAERLSRTYMASGAQATTAIEGNTLSTDEVEKIVDSGTAGLGESRRYQEQEVRNVLEAVHQIGLALRGGQHIPITVDRLCELNALVLLDVPDEAHVMPGELRTYGVQVGPYRPPHWQDVPALLKDFENWLRRLRQRVSADSPIEDRFVVAVTAAVMAHLYIAWIHPFGNGNGRLARLVEVQILSESGIVPIVSTQLLSNHFNLTRDAYYSHLNRAQHPGGVAEFIHYAVQGFTDQLRLQIDKVREQNHEIVWASYVHEVFDVKHKNTEVRKRQQKLALALPVERLTSPEQATDLTIELARLYATAGERMPARDLNDLVKLKLAFKVGRRYVPRRDIIQGFLPPVSS